MTYLLNILIMSILSALTLGFFPYLTVANTVPLVPLFFVILLTYFRKGFEPILLAAISGIILDIFSAYDFGFYILFFLFTAVLIRVIFIEGLKEVSFSGYMAISGGALFLYYLAQVGVLYLDDVSLEFVDLLLPLLYLVLVNGVWAVIMYFAGNWYFEKLKMLENYQKRR